jgi:hypothetical protein
LMGGKKNFFRRGYIDLRMHEEGYRVYRRLLRGDATSKPRGKRASLILFVASHLSDHRSKGSRRAAIRRNRMGTACGPVRSSMVTTS